MNWVCKLLGHNWSFPVFMLGRGSGPINLSDYTCVRCPKIRANGDLSNNNGPAWFTGGGGWRVKYD